MKKEFFLKDKKEKVQPTAGRKKNQADSSLVRRLQQTHGKNHGISPMGGRNR